MKQVKQSSKAHIALPFLCLFCMAAIGALVFWMSGGTISLAQPQAAEASSQDEQASSSENSGTTSAAGFFLERTIFIGDSRTHGLSTYGYLPEDRVYAVDGSNQQTIQQQAFIDMGDGRLKTSGQALAISKPQNVLLAFGINGLPSLDETTFLEEYRNLVSIVKKSSPQSKIYIQAILPVSSAQELNVPKMSNRRIDAFNALLKEYAQQEGYVFLDFSDALKNNNNALASQYDAGDGLHFNSTAYQRILAELTRLTENS